MHKSAKNEGSKEQLPLGQCKKLIRQQARFHRLVYTPSLAVAVVQSRMEVTISCPLGAQVHIVKHTTKAAHCTIRQHQWNRRSLLTIVSRFAAWQPGPRHTMMASVLPACVLSCIPTMDKYCPMRVVARLASGAALSGERACKRMAKSSNHESGAAEQGLALSWEIRA